MKLKNILRKIYYLRSFRNFKSYGANILLGPKGLIARANEISFGSNVYIARNFFISARNLTVGDNVMIGPNLVIECDNHVYNKIGLPMFSYWEIKKGGYATICNDVWIGANVTILTDVEIGEGCIVGAGSLVNKSLPAYTICVGVPCKPIKRRFTDIDLKKHLENVNSELSYLKIIDNQNKAF